MQMPKTQVTQNQLIRNIKERQENNQENENDTEEENGSGESRTRRRARRANIWVTELSEKQNNRVELIFKTINQQNVLGEETDLNLYLKMSHWIFPTRQAGSGQSRPRTHPGRTRSQAGETRCSQRLQQSTLLHPVGSPNR